MMFVGFQEGPYVGHEHYAGVKQIRDVYEYLFLLLFSFEAQIVFAFARDLRDLGAWHQ